MTKEVLVVIGAGGIGQAIARRQGPGRSVLLADLDEASLQATAQALWDAGLEVSTQRVDVSSRGSVLALARAAAAVGPVHQVVMAAGISPAMASPQSVLAVDLVGTALVLEEFGQVIAPGGAGIVISSMAGHRRARFHPDTADALASTPADELLDLPALSAEAVPDSVTAYEVSKQANLLRVQAASIPWGKRGARINSLSPGVILTPLADKELSSPRSAGLRHMVEVSPMRRPGTTDEVAAAAAFLLGSEAGFITGSDLLIDGGVIAALRAGLWSLEAATPAPVSPPAAPGSPPPPPSAPMALPPEVDLSTLPPPPDLPSPPPPPADEPSS